MGHFVNREIEEYTDDLNTSYFLNGDYPKPNIFIDDIEGFIYKWFASNPFKEKMYYRNPITYWK